MKATMHAVFSADRYHDTDIRSVKFVRALRGKPSNMGKDEIVVKLILDIPANAFNPFEPEAVVTIPAELASRADIEVEVANANESSNG